MYHDDFIPPYDLDGGNFDRLKEIEAVDVQASEHRRRARDNAYAAVRSLERALADPELCHRLSRVVISSIECQLLDRLFRKLLPLILAEVAKEKILIYREARPCGFTTVSFSSADPKWEESLTEWMLDRIGPILETVFTKRRTKGAK